MAEQQTGFTMIPNWVLMHPDLGRVDIAVYLVIAHHADNLTRESFPGKKLIMAEAKLGSEYYLRTSLRRLEEVGAIETGFRPGYSNRYRLPKDAPTGR